ncbi:hypothetical protein OG762_45470 [Streptomyces sp. NBC_01136]|uniref:hypothetical protein n=1 Tax=unclassified Streptomyces TaxID=2593676 RepID=UPI00325529F3|nr:hypothetical protein OG762_45470 [Streptomyces sp. NBC_01136]
MPEVPVRKYYTGGQRREATAGATFGDFGPCTGKVFAHVADGGGVEARFAVEAAAEVFPAWAALAPTSPTRFSATGWWPPRTAPSVRPSRRSDMPPDLYPTLPELGAYAPPVSKVAAR